MDMLEARRIDLSTWQKMMRKIDNEQLREIITKIKITTPPHI